MEELYKSLDIPDLYQSAEQVAHYCKGDIDAIIEHSVGLSGAMGAVTGLFGFFTTTYSAITGDVYISTKIHLRMILAIAIVRGYDLFEQGTFVKAANCIDWENRFHVSGWKQIPIAGLLAGGIGDPITCQQAAGAALRAFPVIQS